MKPELLKLAERIAKECLQKKAVIVTAESCTGGQIAWVLTSVSGSSNWFDRGYVTYSNGAKQENLGVPGSCLQQLGAVSKETAIAMAEGALTHSSATVSVVTTGIAGPTGGSQEKPVGTVWIAWAKKGESAIAQHFLFRGDRLKIRDLTVEQSLLGLLKVV